MDAPYQPVDLKEARKALDRALNSPTRSVYLEAAVTFTERYGVDLIAEVERLRVPLLARSIRSRYEDD